LLGLFFVTIGMLLNAQVVVEQFGWVLLALLVPVTLKFALVVVLARGFGASAGTAIRTALPLATAGEFGFVLLNQAGALDLIPEVVMQVVLAAMLLSMLITPFLVHFSDRIAMRFAASEWLTASLNLTQLAARTMSTAQHVIICGYGRSGQHLAKLLEQEHLDYVALDLDPDRVRAAAAAGHSVVYGNAARRETLMAAGIAKAAALVVSYNHVGSALKVIHFAHELKPGLPIIVRTPDDADIDRLLAAGATEVVPEIFEGSLMLGSHALILLGVPLQRVLRRVQAARTSRYRLLRGYFYGADDRDRIEDFDDEGRAQLHAVSIDPDAAAVGKRLGELALESLGAEVTAVRRRGIRGDEPGVDLMLEPGDVVVLRGPAVALDLAEERLLQR